MIILNPNVGVAPGTTTMQLGACSADARRGYTAAPYAQTSVTADNGGTIMNPYADIPLLRGLRGLGITAPRWGLVLFAGLATFALVLGARHWQRRR
jgi:hypothetical protein